MCCFKPNGVVSPARGDGKPILKLIPAADLLLPGEPETPFYGLRAFALGLDAERRRLDQMALHAALETLNAQEGQE